MGRQRRRTFGTCGVSGACALRTACEWTQWVGRTPTPHSATRRERRTRSHIGNPGSTPEDKAAGARAQPPLAVHARGRVPLQREVRCPQTLDVVDVVQERCEPHRLVPLRNFTYPLQRTGRACPALGPGRVLLARVPFGQPPSLHPLRRRSPSVVRRLRRYYGAVRLPVVVHHRRASLDFPARPLTPSVRGDHGPSRFSREVCPSMPGVSDRAELQRVSRWRRTGYGLPLLLTASALRSGLSRLNTRPARTPVNASRTAAHDSGPVRVASPSPYDSCIRNTSPV